MSISNPIRVWCSSEVHQIDRTTLSRHLTVRIATQPMGVDNNISKCTFTVEVDPTFWVVACIMNSHVVLMTIPCDKVPKIALVKQQALPSILHNFYVFCNVIRDNRRDVRTLYDVQWQQGLVTLEYGWFIEYGCISIYAISRHPAGGIQQVCEHIISRSI